MILFLTALAYLLLALSSLRNTLTPPAVDAESRGGTSVTR